MNGWPNDLPHSADFVPLPQELHALLGNRVAGEVKLDLQQLLYRHMLRLGPGYFNQERTGEVVLAIST
jgi:ABC-type bacteriocin/lantibiotic exporter with double-glycine peptidase domain